MSNIVVHKTSELDLSTNFTNNFLDGLLEQYCSNKYTENTVIAEDVPKITLDTLIKFAYPGYYCKAPGLISQVILVSNQSHKQMNSSVLILNSEL